MSVKVEKVEKSNKITDEAPINTESSKDIAILIETVKDLIKENKLKKAKKLFYKGKKKACTPEGIQLFERYNSDVFFFLNTSIKPPSNSKIFKLKNSGIKNEEGFFINILWIKWLIPFYPLKAFVYNKEKEYVGSVKVPKKYDAIKFFVIALFLGLTVFLSYHFNTFLHQPKKIKNAAKVYTTISKSVSKDEKFKNIFNFLKQTEYRNTDPYNEAFKEFHSLIVHMFTLYIKNHRVEQFVGEIGRHMGFMQRKERVSVVQFMYPYISKFLSQNNFKPQNLIEWVIKFGGYSIGKKIIEEQIIHYQKTGKSKDIKTPIQTAHKFMIKLSRNILQPLVKSNIIDFREGLIIAENFKDLKEELWIKALLEIWEMKSPLKLRECYIIIEKSEKKLPELHCNLLKILLDKDKKDAYTWKETKLNFKYPAIEKRIKIITCNYLLLNGKTNKALSLARTIPEHPDNESLYFLRIPILFYQKKYEHIIYFLEKNNSFERDAYINSILGLSYVHTKQFTKGKNILRPLIINKFENYIDLWAKLNVRKKVIRNFILTKFKEKKGKYEATARKIYLMQNDKAASIATETFILKETEKDFNVQKLKLTLTKNYYISNSIFGLIESYLSDKNTSELRKARDILLALRNEYYDYNTELFLGRVFFYLGKKKGVEEILTSLKTKCFQLKEYPPLIDLLRVYHALNLLN